MSQKNFALITGLIFLGVTAGHALRLLYGWNVVVNEWELPMWLSGTGVMVAGFLAYHGLRLSK